MEFNFIACFVAALATFALGFVWYHPKAFGNAWMQQVGMTPEKAKKGNMPLIFGLSFVFAFLVAIFLTVNVKVGGEELRYHTFQHGMLHGAALAILIALPIIATNNLYEQRSWKLILINFGYWLLAFMLIGGIVSLWR